MSEDAMALCDKLRSVGWLVASHNDYRAGAVVRTYWSFSRGSLFIDGDGENDFLALLECTAQARRLETHKAIPGHLQNLPIDSTAPLPHPDKCPNCGATRHCGYDDAGPFNPS